MKTYFMQMYGKGNHAIFDTNFLLYTHERTELFNFHISYRKGMV